MEIPGAIFGLCLASLALLATLGVGVVVLVKLGVLTKYALQDEPLDQSSYTLDQSREAEES
jgi:hypothetical protein